jgi:death-on-curing protein
MSKPIYLDKVHLLILHDAAILLFGGAEGIRDPGALEAILHQPKQRFSGQSLYPDLWHKAAAYAYFICKDHPFVDGNKRTAAYAANAFLRLNGHTLKPEPGSLEPFFVSIAEGHTDIEEISDWIEANSLPV